MKWNTEEKLTSRHKNPRIQKIPARQSEICSMTSSETMESMLYIQEAQSSQIFMADSLVIHFTPGCSVTRYSLPTE